MKLLNHIVNFGVKSGQAAHEVRKIKITNLLNLAALFFIVISYANYFILGRDFALVPLTGLLFLSGLSLVLSKLKKTDISFLLFTFYVNLAIFYFCQYHTMEAGTYLFYFPLVISVVLLNTPALKNKFSLMHFSICVIFFTLTFSIRIPGFEIHLAQQKIDYLHTFNIFASISLTAFLCILLTRLIESQNKEIIVQNVDLIKTKEAVNVSLKEKEILLAELHHRVKNNLAIISGLLNLQDDATTNEEAKDIISDSKARIMSMALVHRMLYDTSELKSLNLGRYSLELVNELFMSYNLEKHVNIRQDCDTIILPVSKSIPLGLILNEIVTNSIKYVFRKPQKEKGEFYISIKERDNQVAMVVKDNGNGFPESFNFEAENPSLGIYLIRTLTEQIDGKVNFSNDNGAKIELNFALH